MAGRITINGTSHEGVYASVGS